MRRIEIKYKREPQGAYPLAPPSEMMMSDNPIAKASSFGLDFVWDFSLIKVQDRNLILCIDAKGNVIREYPRSMGVYRIGLGTGIQVPMGWDFYAHPFVTGGLPYVIEKIPNEFTPLILFLKDDNFPMELKPRRVLLKVIPIIDEDYHFEYSPVAMEEG